MTTKCVKTLVRTSVQKEVLKSKTITFKQLLDFYNFVLVGACFSHRHYSNDLYKIQVVNITGTATIIRDKDIVAVLNIHDQFIPSGLLVI